MYDLLNDYVLFAKIFIFFFFLRWLMGTVGNNRFLFVVGLLIGGYYILFARWSVLGILILLFILFILKGVGGFMQDMIFQYDSIRGMEFEEMERGRPLNVMERLRRF